MLATRPAAKTPAGRDKTRNSLDLELLILNQQNLNLIMPSTFRGDSGGPLVCPLTKESSVYTLIGLTSYGPISCGSPIPGVYTFVHHYVDWIGKHTEEGK